MWRRSAGSGGSRSAILHLEKCVREAAAGQGALRVPPTKFVEVLLAPGGRGPGGSGAGRGCGAAVRASVSRAGGDVRVEILLKNGRSLRAGPGLTRSWCGRCWRGGERGTMGLAEFARAERIPPGGAAARIWRKGTLNDDRLESRCWSIRLASQRGSTAVVSSADLGGGKVKWLHTVNQRGTVRVVGGP